MIFVFRLLSLQTLAWSENEAKRTSASKRLDGGYLAYQNWTRLNGWDVISLWLRC